MIVTFMQIMIQRTWRVKRRCCRITTKVTRTATTNMTTTAQLNE